MGRDRLPPFVHGLDPALGKARRPVRAKVVLHRGDRHISRGLRIVRAQPFDVRAHRVPSRAGSRRRGTHHRCPGDRRRHRLAARTRPLHGALRSDVRSRDGARTAPRRLLRRLPVVAVGLLHQPTHRDRRPVRHDRPAPRPPEEGQPRDRLPRVGTARSRRDGARAVHEPRRHHVSVGIP